MDDDRSKARIFVAADLVDGLEFDLTPEQAHYLGRVLRLRPGDAVDLFNGRDGEWRARLTGIARHAGSARVDSRLRPQAAEPDLWLAFAPIKRQRIDILVEKATELGASRLLPVFTRHTDVTRVNLERLRAHAMEAAEQCERLSVPEVAEPVTLDALIDAWPADRPLLVLDERGAAPPLAEVVGRLDAARGGALIGPEGGFAAMELDALRKLPFVFPVGLGPRILRADTAAVAVLSCWQALAGDWHERPPAGPDRENSAH